MIQVKVTEDLETCFQIRRKVFVEEQGVPEDAETDAFEKEATHFLAFYDKKPAGVARFRKKGPLLKFERFATLPENRNQGIGSHLMKKMLEEAKKYPAYLPAMHAQITATTFHAQFGWVPIGENFFEEGIEHVLMILPPKKREDLLVFKDLSAPKEILSYLKKLT